MLSLANSIKLVLKGQYDDVRKNAILEGYRCKNETCDGFLLRTTGMSLPMPMAPVNVK